MTSKKIQRGINLTDDEALKLARLMSPISSKHEFRNDTIHGTIPETRILIDITRTENIDNELDGYTLCIYHGENRLYGSYFDFYKREDIVKESEEIFSGLKKKLLDKSPTFEEGIKECWSLLEKTYGDRTI